MNELSQRAKELSARLEKLEQEFAPLYLTGKYFYKEYNRLLDRQHQQKLLKQKRFWLGLTYNEKQRLV